MDMPPEFRLATVTNYVVDIKSRLSNPCFHGSMLADCS
jgi:hypothetical protein